MSPQTTNRLERVYSTSAEHLWELWTTPAGIEQWWSPDGFTVDVEELDLRPGGTLVYTMTATAPEQVEFMRSAGMPLSTQSRKTFTDVEPGKRLAYSSLVDFVPDHEPYEFMTVVEFEPDPGGVRAVMTVEAMHDDVWTERLLAGRANELENLARLVEGR